MLLPRKHVVWRGLQRTARPRGQRHHGGGGKIDVCACILPDDGRVLIVADPNADVGGLGPFLRAWDDDRYLAGIFYANLALHYCLLKLRRPIGLLQDEKLTVLYTSAEKREVLSVVARH